MKTRIITGAVLTCILFSALYFGGYYAASWMVICVALSVYEMYNVLKKKGYRCVIWPSCLCVAVSVPLFMEVQSSVSLIATLVMATSMLITTMVLIRSDPRLEDIAVSLLPMVAILIPGMCLLGILKNAGGPDRLLQITLLVLAFGIPLFGDTMAYFIGSRYGRRKLCPKVSPNKSVEGAVAGLAGSMLFSLIVYFVVGAFGDVYPFWHFLLLGLFCGIAGQTGDLFASMIKRLCGVKDYGNIFPGHGGMMDRLDSVYWAAIIVYIYLNWVMH